MKGAADAKVFASQRMRRCPLTPDRSNAVTRRQRIVPRTSPDELGPQSIDGHPSERWRVAEGAIVRYVSP